MRCSKRLPLILSALALPLLIFAGTADAKEKKIEDIEVFEPELWQLHAHGHHHLNKNHNSHHYHSNSKNKKKNNNNNNHHKHKESSKKTKSKSSKKLSLSSQNNGRNLAQSNSDKIAGYAAFEPELWQLRAHGHNHLLKKKKNSKKHQKNKKSITKKSASEKKKLNTKVAKRDLVEQNNQQRILAEADDDSNEESESNDTEEDTEGEVAQGHEHENGKDEEKHSNPEDEEHSKHDDDKDHNLDHSEDESANEDKKEHGGKNKDKHSGKNEGGEKKGKKGGKKSDKKDGKKDDQDDKKDDHDDKKDGQDDKEEDTDDKEEEGNDDKEEDNDDMKEGEEDQEEDNDDKKEDKEDKAPKDNADKDAKVPEKEKAPADTKAPEKEKTTPAVPAPTAKPPTPAPVVPVQNMGEFLTKCNTVGQVALTFSEGPSEATTQMLEILKEAKARVTFFANATWLDYMQYASVTRRAYQEGHLIGMTYRLPNDSSNTLTEAQLKADIAKYATKIFSLIGKYPKYVRLHDAGLKDPKLEPTIRQMGYTLVGFNLDQADYKFNTREKANKIAEIYDTTFKQQADAFGRKASYVAVGYDIPASGAAAALPEIINAVIRNGYDMVRLDGCNNDNMPYKKSPMMNDGFVKDDFSFGGSKYVHGQSPVSVLKNGKVVPGQIPSKVGENKRSSGNLLAVPSAMGIIFATALALIL
ncbi:hypothetical protein BGZ51_005456 [Haplosporangium sp. Z 767]|nr:hypothetical protein BGZ51_005456 [Haplosporangium sp. Z 767]